MQISFDTKRGTRPALNRSAASATRYLDIPLESRYNALGKRPDPGHTEERLNRLMPCENIREI